MTDNLTRASGITMPSEPEHVPADRSNHARPAARRLDRGGRAGRLIALIDFYLTSHRLYERDDPLKTFQQWVEKGTGPRDFDYERFDRSDDPYHGTPITPVSSFIE